MEHEIKGHAVKAYKVWAGNHTFFNEKNCSHKIGPATNSTVKGRHVTVIFSAVFIFFLSLFIAKSSYGQIKINIDNSNASLVFQILKTGNKSLIDSLITKTSTGLLIQQAQKFDKKATATTFTQELLQLTQDSTANFYHSSFRFREVKKNIKKLETLYQCTVNSNQELNNFLNEQFGKYLQPSDTLTIDAYLLLGGTSDGFANDNVFCLDLGFFRDDIDAMKLLLVHEMFHIVQETLYKRTYELSKRLSEKENSQLNLVRALFKEGSATMIANPLLVNNPKDYTKWFQEKYKLNQERISDNFQLFQSIYFRVLFDDALLYEDVYPIGFSARWESPFYFVGYRMCELIKKYEGDNFLNKYLRNNPFVFVLAYNKYSLMEKNEAVFPYLSKQLVEACYKMNSKVINRTKFLKNEKYN